MNKRSIFLSIGIAFATAIIGSSSVRAMERLLNFEEQRQLWLCRTQNGIYAEAYNLRNFSKGTFVGDSQSEFFMAVNNKGEALTLTALIGRIFDIFEDPKIFERVTALQAYINRYLIVQQQNNHQGQNNNNLNQYRWPQQNYNQNQNNQENIQNNAAWNQQEDDLHFAQKLAAEENVGNNYQQQQQQLLNQQFQQMQIQPPQQQQNANFDMKLWITRLWGTISVPDSLVAIKEVRESFNTSADLENMLVSQGEKNILSLEELIQEIGALGEIFGMNKNDLIVIMNRRTSAFAQKNSINNSNEELLDDCAICYVPMQNKNAQIGNPEERVITTSCNHRFHEKCIDPWKQVVKKCPICRSDLLNHK